MAKPEHTAYQIQADFSNVSHSHEGIVGIDPSCINNKTHLKAVGRFGRSQFDITCCALEDAVIHFGSADASVLMERLREHAKTQFKKGVRPTFFLRKLTMSEFLEHKNFKDYKDNATVKRIFKKYLLLDLIREEGYQMS